MIGKEGGVSKGSLRHAAPKGTCPGISDGTRTFLTFTKLLTFLSCTQPQTMACIFSAVRR